MAVKKGEKQDENAPTKSEQPVVEKQISDQQVPENNNDSLAKAIEMLAGITAQNTNNNNNSGITEEQLTRVLATVNKPQADSYEDEDGYINEEDLDEDDFLDKGGVAFYSHNCGYAIVDDVRKGRRVKLPYGKKKIELTFLHSSKKGEGKNLVIEAVSRYISYSKREVEWLENSSFYGSAIFKDISNKGMSTAAKYASKMSVYFGRVRGMELHELRSGCKAVGIPPMKDYDKMRMALAAFYVDQELEMERESHMVRSENARKERELVKASAPNA